jgi:hypothetical protein
MIIQTSIRMKTLSISWRKIPTPRSRRCSSPMPQKKGYGPTGAVGFIDVEQLAESVINIT